MEHLSPWYRLEDYPRIREIMDDGDKMPKSFGEWVRAVNRQHAEAEAHGVITMKVILDPDKFVAFCKERHFPRGSGERTAFVEWLVENDEHGTEQQQSPAPGT
jgi:hypothetical protein